MSGLRLRGLHRFLRRIRHTRTQNTVRTPLIVMSRPRSQNRTEMYLRHRDHPVEAFAPYRANDPLAIALAFGLAIGDRNTPTPRALIESSTSFAKIRSRS